jgi:hypothetical protein
MRWIIGGVVVAVVVCLFGYVFGIAYCCLIDLICRKTRALLFIQPDENESLRKKFKTVEEIIEDTNPKFILASRYVRRAIGPFLC